MKITFLQMLTLIFIVLKLTDVIDWSWWLVLLPFYGAIILVLIITTVLTLLKK